MKVMMPCYFMEGKKGNFGYTRLHRRDRINKGSAYVSMCVLFFFFFFFKLGISAGIYSTLSARSISLGRYIHNSQRPDLCGMVR